MTNARDAVDARQQQQPCRRCGADLAGKALGLISGEPFCVPCVDVISIERKKKTGGK